MLLLSTAEGVRPMPTLLYAMAGRQTLVTKASPRCLQMLATGGLKVYNIANDQITGAAFLGTVGLDWKFAGVWSKGAKMAKSMPSQLMSLASPMIRDWPTHTVMAAIYFRSWVGRALTPK